jgi:hypothetical protein
MPTYCQGELEDGGVDVVPLDDGVGEGIAQEERRNRKGALELHDNTGTGTVSQGTGDGKMQAKDLDLKMHTQRSSRDGQLLPFVLVGT